MSEDMDDLTVAYMKGKEAGKRESAALITKLEAAAHRDAVQHHKTRTAELEMKAQVATLRARIRELEDAIREVESLPRNHRDTVDLEQMDDWIRKVLGMVEDE